MVLINFHLGVVSNILDVSCLRELATRLTQLKAQTTRRTQSLRNSSTTSGVDSRKTRSQNGLNASRIHPPEVSTFFRRHGVIVREMLFYNDTIVAPFFVLVLAFNVPFSLSMSALLLSGSITSFARSIGLFLCALQLLFITAAVLMSERQRVAVYAPAKALLNVQGALSASGSGSGGRYLALKLRLDSFYLALTGPYRLKLTFNVGLLSSITLGNFAKVS